MRNLAGLLKDHLYNMIVNNLTWEYQDQIEKWKLYIAEVLFAKSSWRRQKLYAPAPFCNFPSFARSASDGTDSGSVNFRSGG